METQEHISQISLSRRHKAVLKLSQKLFPAEDVTTLSEEQISQINKKPITGHSLRSRLFKRTDKTVEHDTFIIPVENGALTGYFFKPRKTSRSQISSLKPLIIFYHGGGWVFGNMNIYRLVCSRLASLTNAAVLAVDYRLAPGHKFPTAVEDCYEAFLWASHGVRYWKIDPERIYVMGDSAGGNLAAVVTRLARDRKGPPIAGQILVYPVTDGRMKTSSYDEYRDSPTLTQKEMQFYIKSYQREPKDILNPQFSPLLSKDHSRLPPALIIAAGWDPLKDDARLYGEALRSADTPVKYLECEQALHGYFLYPEAPGCDESESAIMQFISGRSLDSVALITKKEMERHIRDERRKLRKVNKNYVSVEGT
ncbi:MAG: alpha/beta hydrolase [Sphaerochaetaceae bacterium]|nr:alpha/beta hydrolase [Sphaerochaetaceae bacterium]